MVDDVVPHWLGIPTGGGGGAEAGRGSDMGVGGGGAALGTLV